MKIKTQVKFRKRNMVTTYFQKLHSSFGFIQDTITSLLGESPMFVLSIHHSNLCCYMDFYSLYDFTLHSRQLIDHVSATFHILWVIQITGSRLRGLNANCGALLFVGIHMNSAKQPVPLDRARLAVSPSLYAKLTSC